VNEIPTPEVLAAYYAAYVDKYEGGGNSGGANMLRYAKVYQCLAQQHAPFTGKLRRTLDVGASNNPFPSLMCDTSDVTMVDYVRPTQLDERVHFLPGHLGCPALFAGMAATFDLVTCWAVLEHVPDPQTAVHNLCIACSPDGTVIVSSPEIGTFLTAHSLGHSGWFFPPEHLHLISPTAMGLLFANEGFKLKAWGRLELSPLRYLARYGIGVAEMLAGGAIRLVSPKRWTEARLRRKHKFKGITWFAFNRI
jgi:hypothetical protein